jgi:hypothetical protein
MTSEQNQVADLNAYLLQIAALTHIELGDPRLD